jgi:hypothetical protein
LTQASFNLFGEVVGAVVGIEGGDELSARRLEPALEEALERRPLPLDLGLVRIVGASGEDAVPPDPRRERLGQVLAPCTPASCPS